MSRHAPRASHNRFTLLPEGLGFYMYICLCLGMCIEGLRDFLKLKSDPRLSATLMYFNNIYILIIYVSAERVSDDNDGACTSQCRASRYGKM